MSNAADAASGEGDAEAASLDQVADAFVQLDRRPAVFDREIRARLGLWKLAEPVPTDPIIAAFKQHGAFTNDGATVVLPLHEERSADLTGEYLVYHPTHIVPCVVFHDYSKGGLARIPVDEFAGTYPAWRLRFWHPDYEPEAWPAYLAGGVDAAVIAAGSEFTVPASSPADPPDDAETDPTEGDAPAPSRRSADVLEELRSFVNREREAARESARQRFARLSPAEYCRIAGGIPEMVPAGTEVDDYGQQVVNLRVPSEAIDGSVDITDVYGIYPGSEVIVGCEDDDGFPIEAEVLDITGRQLGLGVYWNRGETGRAAVEAFELESDRRFAVGELLNPVPFERELDAIAAVGEDDRKRGILSGETPLEFSSSLDVSIRKGRLNNDQFRAAQNALRARDIYCIHGPPGTGKTRTLIELVKAVAAEGKRVVVCAHSNQAVDNLLVGDSTDDTPDDNSLHAAALDGDLTVARAGSNSSSDLVAERYEGNDLYQSDVVCATLSAAHRFGENIFDLAVVDEATQATIPSTLIPMACAKRVVLAGDHKQLPPYHSGETSDDERMEISLFEQVLSTYGDDVVSLLRTQYRMNEEIAAFPNRAFYDGKLLDGVRNRRWTLSTFAPLAAHQVDGTEARTPANSYYNEDEAQRVADEVAGLLEKGVPPASIGVITPYSGQVSKIRSRLATLDEPGVNSAIDVSTVDSFQGSERDAIIISFVRSNPEGFSGFLTFPNEGPRRLNVAMTRARRRCVLIGNFDTLRTRAPNRRPGESAASVYQELYDFLVERGLV